MKKVITDLFNNFFLAVVLVILSSTLQAQILPSSSGVCQANVFLKDVVEFTKGLGAAGVLVTCNPKFLAVRGEFTKKVLQNNGILPISVNEDLGSGIFTKPTSSDGHHYLTINSLGKSKLTPEQVFGLMSQDLTKVFPYLDAKTPGTQSGAVKVGNTYDLTSDFVPKEIKTPMIETPVTVTPFLMPIKVIDVSKYYFTVEAFGAHILKGKATHGVFKDKTGELWLFHEGIGIKDENILLQSANYNMATLMWARMATNIKKIMPAQ
jgi:hypothetical protein